MAEAVENTEKKAPAKKGRKASRMPRIDMTPMVDLAFLLLTFFVLTSNLTKPKTMEIAVPGDGPEPSSVYRELARTLLVDDGKIYCYSGMLDAEKPLKEFSTTEELRAFIVAENATIQADMKFLGEVYTSGKFTAENYQRLEQILAKSTASSSTQDVVKKLNEEHYSTSVALMDRDLQLGTMSEETFRKVGSVIRNREEAPVFIVRWCEDAKYGDMISVIDELKIGHVSKYMIAGITDAEKQVIAGQPAK